MAKKLSEYTTDDVFYLNEIGGFISDGVIPQGLSPESTLIEWQEAMPLVIPKLIEIWFNQSVLNRQLAELRMINRIIGN